MILHIFCDLWAIWNHNPRVLLQGWEVRFSPWRRCGDTGAGPKPQEHYPGSTWFPSSEAAASIYQPASIATTFKAAFLMLFKLKPRSDFNFINVVLLTAPTSKSSPDWCESNTIPHPRFSDGTPIKPKRGYIITPNKHNALWHQINPNCNKHFNILVPGVQVIHSNLRLLGLSVWKQRCDVRGRKGLPCRICSAPWVTNG